MAKQWFACPHCVLSFEQLDQYKEHHTKEHPGQKYRAPEPIKTQTEQY